MGAGRACRGNFSYHFRELASWRDIVLLTSPETDISIEMAHTRYSWAWLERGGRIGVPDRAAALLLQPGPATLLAGQLSRAGDAVLPGILRDDTLLMASVRTRSGSGRCVILHKKYRDNF